MTDNNLVAVDKDRTANNVPNLGLQLIEDAPKDSDLTGRFTDVSGDGDFSIADIQRLFITRNDPLIQDLGHAFDFNSDGRFSIGDIQWLFVNRDSPATDAIDMGDGSDGTIKIKLWSHESVYNEYGYTPQEIARRYLLSCCRNAYANPGLGHNYTVEVTTAERVISPDEVRLDQRFNGSHFDGEIDGGWIDWDQLVGDDSVDTVKDSNMLLTNTPGPFDPEPTPPFGGLAELGGDTALHPMLTD